MTSPEVFYKNYVLRNFAKFTGKLTQGIRTIKTLIKCGKGCSY